RALGSRSGRAQRLCAPGGPPVEGAGRADWFGEGRVARHVSRSRQRSAGRRTALLEAVRDHLGARAEVTGADAGLHVLLWLRGVPVARLPAIVRAAEGVGVGVYPVTPHCRETPRDAGLVLGYASLTEQSIREGIRRLGRVIPRPER